MKLITFTLSGADGENLGSFTLDPYAQLCLMADGQGKQEAKPDGVRERIHPQLHSTGHV